MPVDRQLEFGVVFFTGHYNLMLRCTIWQVGCDTGAPTLAALFNCAYFVAITDLILLLLLLLQQRLRLHQVADGTFA